MSLPKKIIVAVDGSEPSLKAVTFASQLSKLTGSRLTMLNVVLLPAFVSPDTLQSLRSELVKKSEQLLERSKAIASTAGMGASTKAVETTRSVVETIVDTSEKEGADLIVVGSRGMTMGKLMLGSIAAGTANL